MDKLFQDLRYTLRLVRKNPGFSVLLVMIVAIGVGSAATIFSIVEKSLLWNENPNVDRWIVVRSFLSPPESQHQSLLSGGIFRLARPHGRL